METEFLSRLKSLLDALHYVQEVDSPTFVFNEVESARVWQVVTMFYCGTDSIGVNVESTSNSMVGFRVFGSQRQSIIKLKPTFVIGHERFDYLQGVLMSPVGIASLSLREFVSEYFPISVT